MSKIIQNLLDSKVDLGPGIRLAPRGAAGSFQDISDEQAALPAVVGMQTARKVRIMSTEEHAQFMGVAGKVAAPKEASKPEPVKEEPKPEPEPEPEPVKEEVQPEPEPEPAPEPAPEPEPAEDSTPEKAPESKGRKKKKSRKNKG